MNSRKLRAMRVEYGYTQKKLAKIIGMSVKTYNRKELGLIDFTCKEIQDVSKTLELSLNNVNDIFFDNEIMERALK